MSYIRACVDESRPDEAVELPLEDDNTLLLSVLQSQFEGATGLKYRNPASGAWRAVRVKQEQINAPVDGWGNQLYVVVKSSASPAVSTVDEGSADGNKRKMDEASDDRAAKNPRHARFPSPEKNDEEEEDDDDSPHHDLIVLGLAYRIEQAELRDYFQQFGEVLSAEVKRDSNTGQSRGFGFVRFKNYQIQQEVANAEHMIGGRKVEIKRSRKSEHPTKLFIGHLPFFSSKDEFLKELRAHFRKFGHIMDLHIPSNYRGFGFITYREGEDARTALNSNHYFQGRTLNLTVANPKKSFEMDEQPPLPGLLDMEYHRHHRQLQQHPLAHERQEYHHGHECYQQTPSSYNMYGNSNPQSAPLHQFTGGYMTQHGPKQPQHSSQMYVIPPGASKDGEMLMRAPPHIGGYAATPFMKPGL